MTPPGLLLLIPLLLTPQPSSARLLVLDVAGERLPDRTRLEAQWESSSAKPLGTFEGEIGEGYLSLPPRPRGAEVVRIVGPRAVSAPLSLSEESRLLQLVPSSTLRIFDIPTTAGILAVWMRLQANGAVFRRSIVLRPGSAPPELLVPTGPHDIVLDFGMAHPVHSEAGVTLGPSEVRTIVLTSAVSRRVSIQAVTKIGARPVEGASIVPPENDGAPAVYWEALKERCGRSGRDGRLDCGAVSPSTGSLGVAAEGLRSSTISLSTETDPAASGAVVAKLSPFVDVHLVVPGLDDPLREGLMAILRPCSTGRCTDDTKDRRVPFGTRPSASFSKVPPGDYQAWVETPSCRSDERFIRVPAWSDAADVLQLALPLQSYRAAGRLSLEDGTPLQGTVWLEIVPEGVPRGTLAGRVDSASDGYFELEFLASPGSSLWPMARSRGVPAEGRFVPGIRLGEDGSVPWIDLRLSQAGLRVRLVDRTDRAPVEGCGVLFSYRNEISSGLEPETSDASGVAIRAGLREGRITAAAECVGYEPATTGELELDGTLLERTIEMEPAGDVRIVIRSFHGGPLAGATVFVTTQDFESSPFPFFLQPDRVGTSGYDGSVVVHGRGEAGVFVLAANHALYVDRLPRCIDKGGCTRAIQMSAPAAFAGLTVQDADGTGLPAAWVVFSKHGVPIPLAIQQELIRVAGIDARGIIQPVGNDWVHLLPGHFGPGTYEIEYSERRTGGSWTRTPLGTISLPTAQRVTFVRPAH